MNELDEIHDHNVNVKDRIIYLHQVDIEDSVSYKTIPNLIKNLDYLNSLGKSSIKIKMMGVDGGCVSQGLAAYASIKSSKCKVNIECYGFSASSGTIILQAASEGGRFISEYGDFCVHYGSISLSSDLISAESALASNKLWRNKMLEIYAKRAINGEFFKDRKYSISKVKAYLNRRFRDAGDWYLKDAEEVIYYGLADHVF